MPEHNRREMTRVLLQLDVILRSKSSPAMLEKTTDVSLKGIRIDCGNPRPVGSTCQLTLLVGPQTDPIRIELGGMVVRVDKSGMAVDIDDVLPIDTLSHLQNIVRYNASDGDCIDQELYTRVSRRWEQTASDNLLK